MNCQIGDIALVVSHPTLLVMTEHIGVMVEIKEKANETQWYCKLIGPQTVDGRGQVLRVGEEVTAEDQFLRPIRPPKIKEEATEDIVVFA